MRESVAASIADAESGELLTTGEVAKILGVSRQHVVDLCDRGDLPYVTVGTHRRIRKSDVLRLQSRTQRLTRDQLRSLWLAHAAAGRLVEDPVRAIASAKDRLDQSETRRNRWDREWRVLLDGSIEEVLEALTSTSPRSRELRQNSPFAGLLSASERERVLMAFARFHPGKPR